MERDRSEAVSAALEAQAAMPGAQVQLDGLSNLWQRLSLAQAACAMAMEGMTRATVLQVVGRAERDHGLEVPASVAGQIFSDFKVRRVAVHGRSRLVLNASRLLEIQESLAGLVDRVEKAAEELKKRFGNVGERVRLLEVDLRSAYDSARREREIRAYLQETRRTPRRLIALEHAYQRARADVARVEQLQAAIIQLEEQVKETGKLEERQKERQRELEARVEAMRARTQECGSEERRVGLEESALDSRAKDLEER